MWRFDYYAQSLGKVLSAIPAYAEKRSAMTGSPDYSDGYKQSKIGELDAQMQETVESAFTEMTQQVTRDLAAAKKKAEGQAVPFEERTYYATIAAQDAAGKQPGDLLALYKKAAESGNRAHRDELARVIGPMLSGKTEDEVKWREVRQASLSEQEVRAERMESASKDLASMMGSLKQHTAWTVENVRDGGDVNAAGGTITSVFEKIGADPRFAGDSMR